MQISLYKDLELNNSSETVELTGNKLGDTVSQVVYLQVLSNATVTLTGTTVKGETATSIGAISMSDFSKKSTITTAGIYMVAAEELYSLTISSTGEVTVLVKVVK